MIVYHGSDHVIQVPKYHGSKRTNDYGYGFYTTENIELAKEIKLIVEDASQYPDWLNREDIRAKLRIDLKIVMHKFGYPPVGIPDVSKDIFAQTDNYKKNLEE